jgi:glutamyl-tRNA reductase
MNTLDITVVGLDHRTASAAKLEAARRCVAGDLELPTGTAGCVGLATCHRLELYLEGPLPARPAELFQAWLGVDGSLPAEPVVRRGEDAVRHLLRVAGGLESAVVGEDQILGQVRAAYRHSCARGAAGPFLHRLFHAAFRTGKRVRAETALGDGGRSLAGAAVTALQCDLGDLSVRSVLVVGLGEMVDLAARRLQRRGVGRLLVCNRTWRRAHAAAGHLGGEAVRWQWRGATLASVDGVVCATGAPQPVLAARWLVDAVSGRERPLAVVDLGMPRNVEKPVAPVAGLELYDLGRLARRLERDASRRRGAVGAAQAVVESELEGYLAWVSGRDRWQRASASPHRHRVSTA